MSALVWERDGLTWPHREASRFIDAGGLRWHVQEMGNGPTLLLIHGTGASTHSWRALMPLLAERFCVIAVDLPGHGFTQALPSSRLTLPGIATAINALLEALALTPAVAIGHSAGAAILIRMAIANRLTSQPIVSLNGALLPFGGFARDLFPALARLLFLNPFVPSFFAWRASDVSVVRRLIADTGSTLDDEGLEYYARLFRSSGHVASALGMMANWDLNALERDLPKLGAPLLLLAGSGDRAIPPDVAFKVRNMIAGPAVEVMRGLGHLAHEERPHEVAQTILTALDNLSHSAEASSPALTQSNTSL